MELLASTNERLPLSILLSRSLSYIYIYEETPIDNLRPPYTMMMTSRRRKQLLLHLSSILLCVFFDIYYNVDFVHAAAAGEGDDVQKLYIVYMGEKPATAPASYNLGQQEEEEETFAVASLHNLLLDQVLQGRTWKDSIVRRYGRSFSGFAATLTEDEKEALAAMEGVVSVFPSTTLWPHTTRSWDFLGLPAPAAPPPPINAGVGSAAALSPSSSSSNWEYDYYYYYGDDGGAATGMAGAPSTSSSTGEFDYYREDMMMNIGTAAAAATTDDTGSGGDVIIGMMDTGIWPESESFGDHGMAPPPKRWKGVCHNFTCNNKLIGARYYRTSTKPIGEGEEHSPRDSDGHGTHTASTAAGRIVENASYCGIAAGAARGAVPSARIAVYKICWHDGCAGVDVLSAFDDAIADGVDVISLSIGASTASDYFNDTISIGSFHAMKNGILTSVSAGNRGPSRGSVTNNAPWIISVAASSMDRRIVDKVELGNNQIIEGVSINPFPTQKEFYPIVQDQTGMCAFDDYNNDVKPQQKRILLCDEVTTTTPISGAAGVVMIDDYSNSYGYTYSLPFPGLIVSTEKGALITDYMNKTKNPVAKIHRSDSAFDATAPLVAQFSSRGPNSITPEILKPDITAPGVNILAARPSKTLNEDSPSGCSSGYFLLSGTSMACPHVTGVAAYVKSIHPDWSPAAIMSAIMTTATPMNESAHSDGALAFGSGQLNPTKAPNPGLIYNITAKDYADMLCNIGYDDKKIRIVTGDKTSSCSSPEQVAAKAATNATARGLNYPSMAFLAQTDGAVTVEFRRTVTNVGPANSLYTAKIVANAAASSNKLMKIKVTPSFLNFTSAEQHKDFVVTVTAPPMDMDAHGSATLVWSDEKEEHIVRSQIVTIVTI